MQRIYVSSDCPFDANGQQMGASVLSRVIFYIFLVLLGIELITVVLQIKSLQDRKGMLFAAVGCILTFPALWAWYYHLQKCRPWTGFGLYLAVTMISYSVLACLLFGRRSDPPIKKEDDVALEGLYEK